MRTTCYVPICTASAADQSCIHAETGHLPRMCWNRKSLAKVVPWTDPTKNDGQEDTSVLYTYRLVNVAPCARKP